MKHGHNTDRLGRSPTYTSWAKMRGRCNNPNDTNFHHYGGRGITVCERWADFTNFLADMGERPEGTSIDRIDVDGNYEPSNCRWATQLEQVRNMRTVNRVTYRGKDFVLNELAEMLGVRHFTLKQRVLAGWPEDRWADAPDKNRYIMPRGHDKGRSRKVIG